jgi:protein phosphatase
LTDVDRNCKGEDGRSPARSFKIGTRTDIGPSRQRNEDACYPASGTTIAKPPEPKAIAIVCDGIGGHEGGNVASNLAIETLQQQIYQLPLDNAALDPITLSAALERFACTANDKISQRNDKEHRQGRQRMGTTLVMAVGHQHEVYITHVGDSRAYWITRTGCHQITLDDDVAAREVRLGYAVYRDAVQQPSAGSLVQAIGMSSSVHPTVQRFTLDEDSVFLLCSDGLSDYDLVEQCWQTEILPILEGKVDVATAVQRLIEVGNTQNGHDNITVALVHCQVRGCEPEVPLSYSLTQPANFSSATDLPAATLQATRPPQEFPLAPSGDTQLLPSKQSSRHGILPLLVGIGLALSLGGGLLLAFLANQGKLPRWLTVYLDSPFGQSSEPISTTTTTEVQPRSFYVTDSKLVLNPRKPEESAIASPSSQQSGQIKNVLPTGSVVEVIKQETSQQGTWYNLRVKEVCSSPDTQRSSANTSKPTPIKPNRPVGSEQPKTATSKSPSVPRGERLAAEGEDGWIAATDVKQYLQPLTTDTLAGRGKCADFAPAPDASVVKSSPPGMPELVKVKEKAN